MTPVPAIHGYVFARGGSDGVHRKNLLEVGGYPLVVRAARLLDEWCSTVTVNSEDHEILGVAKAHGFDTEERPAALSDPGVSLDTVILETIPRNGHLYVVLQPTMATITSPDLGDMIEAFTTLEHEEEMADILHGGMIGVVRSDHLLRDAYGDPLYQQRAQRQDAEEINREVGVRVFRATAGAAIDFTKFDTYALPGPQIDIDTADDYRAAVAHHQRGVVVFEPLARTGFGTGHMRRANIIAERLQHHMVVMAPYGDSEEIADLADYPMVNRGFRFTGGKGVWVCDHLDAPISHYIDIQARGFEVIAIEAPDTEVAEVTYINPFEDPEWMVLRPEFVGLPERDGFSSLADRRVLVMFGGEDPGERTEEFLWAWVGMDGASTHPMGVAASTRWEVRVIRPPQSTRKLATGIPGVTVLEDPVSVAEQMRWAHHVVTSAGVSMFEARVCGAFTWVLPQNQMEESRRGIAEAIGAIFPSSAKSLVRSLRSGWWPPDERGSLEGINGAAKFAHLIEGKLI